ncbi:hypothetical protein [Roseibium sp. MB-4]
MPETEPDKSASQDMGAALEKPGTLQGFIEQSHRYPNGASLGRAASGVQSVLAGTLAWKLQSRRRIGGRGTPVNVQTV